VRAVLLNKRFEHFLAVLVGACLQATFVTATDTLEATAATHVVPWGEGGVVRVGRHHGGDVVVAGRNGVGAARATVLLTLRRGAVVRDGPDDPLRLARPVLQLVDQLAFTQSPPLVLLGGIPLHVL